MFKGGQKTKVGAISPDKEDDSDALMSTQLLESVQSTQSNQSNGKEESVNG